MASTSLEVKRKRIRKPLTPEQKLKRRAYLNVNRERISKKQAEWHQNNKDRARVVNKSWRRRNADKVAIYAGRWASKNRSKVVQRANNWIKRNPQKYRAHQAVKYAIRVGKLVRPNTCQRCGSERSIHAHHEDYSKKLDVLWLCHACHVDVHRK